MKKATGASSSDVLSIDFDRPAEEILAQKETVQSRVQGINRRYKARPAGFARVARARHVAIALRQLPVQLVCLSGSAAAAPTFSAKLGSKLEEAAALIFAQQLAWLGSKAGMTMYVWKAAGGRTGGWRVNSIVLISSKRTRCGEGRRATV